MRISAANIWIPHPRFLFSDVNDTLMEEMNSRVEVEAEVMRLRAEGMSCSKATFLALCHIFEVDLPEETLLRMASGFGGGIGRTHAGGTCGALTGAVMALGLLSDNDTESLGRSAELYRRFEAERGGVACGALLKAAGGKGHCNACCLCAATNAAALLSGATDPYPPK